MEQTQLTATSILALFETNKEQRSDFARLIVEAIEKGEINPLKAHLQIKGMEDIISSLTVVDEKKNSNFEYAKRYRQELLNVAGLYGKKFDLFHGKFDVKEVGTKYDYSECNDSKLLELETALEKASNELKARQKFLQNVPESGAIITDNETGDTYTIYRPKKTSTTAVTVTLK